MTSLISPLGWSILLMVAGWRWWCSKCSYLLGVSSVRFRPFASWYRSSSHSAKARPRVLPSRPRRILSVPTLLVLAFKYWPKTPMGKSFLGDLPTEKEVAPEDPRRALIGRVGIARSKMLPSGAVEIDGQMIDAVTQGQAIEPGAYVTVIEVRANRVVVRPAAKNQRPHHQNGNDLLSRPIEELGIESLEDPLA